MKEFNILKRNIGVVFTETSTEITIWAPLAEAIEIQFNDSSLSLSKENFGYWFLETDRIKSGDRYMIGIDGKSFPDVASLSQPDGVTESSEAINLNEFQWKDEGWQLPPLKDFIIYELHTGTFSNEGTFDGIATKLDYLLELGVTAIEIMPVAQFSGWRNWGYDGVYPFAVQSSYGGPKKLQELIDECHKKGLAVILDVVYNHIGPEGNYLGNYGPYFTEKYNTPWGNAINFDDAWSDGVRNYYIENVLMWFRDFHVDALRLDAVHAIKDLGATHFLQETKLAVDRLMKQTGRAHYLIVELDLNDSKFIDPLDKKGYGMDAQWIDEFHHALRVTAGGERNGYYSDFNGIEHLEKSFKDAYVYDGVYSPHRKKTFGNKATENPAEQFIVFSQNHDQVGNRMLGERSSVLFSFEMQKLMAATVMCSPFLPMLFMGEEYGETNPFLYFVSHSDADLIKAVQKGRHDEFASFHTEGEAPDPQSEDTFNASKLNWSLLEDPRHAKMLEYYRALISLRKTFPVFHEANRENLQVKCSKTQNCLILERWESNQRVFCFMNFSDVEQQLAAPDPKETWRIIFDSADPVWLGPKESPPLLDGQNESISLLPESILIYTNKL
jgi:maltooligosyltrehalose trehalohydrolase